MSSMTPELVDQHGYLFRMHVRGAVRYGDLLIRNRHVRVLVNDDFVHGVQYVHAQPRLEDLIELGDPNTHLLPVGANGRLEILTTRDKDPTAVPRWLAGLFRDSVVAIVVYHPEDDFELRRITLYGCRWEPPTAEITVSGGYLHSVDFRADRYTDE